MGLEEDVTDQEVLLFKVIRVSSIIPNSNLNSVRNICDLHLKLEVFASQDDRAHDFVAQEKNLQFSS